MGACGCACFCGCVSLCEGELCGLVYLCLCVLCLRMCVPVCACFPVCGACECELEWGCVCVRMCVCLFMRVTKGNSESGESTEGTEDPREMGKWKDRENEWVKEARSGEASAQGQRQRAEGRERRMDTGGEERRATGMPGLRISGVSKCPWGAQM